MFSKEILMVQLIFENVHALIFCALFALVLFLLLRPLAIKISLLDTRNKRNFDQDQVPLIGGISIFLASFLTSFIFFDIIFIDLYPLLICGGWMLLLGVVDDKFDLSAYKKLFFQALIILTFIITTDLTIKDLGTPLGFSSSLELGLLSVPFTFFAILGLTNAFNLIDGCDGLASSMTIIALLALLIFDTSGLKDSNQLLMLLLVTSLIVFMFLNFSNNKNIKIFLGDAGSLFLGFIVATSLVEFADKNTLYDPSIVIWFTAIPIFDLCTVIVKRKLLKRNIMAADRSHIHHQLLSRGFSDFYTTSVISSSALILLLFGVFVTINHPNLGFWSFLAFLILYLSIQIFSSKTK